MLLTVNLNDADAALFERYAASTNQTIEEAMRKATRKAANNAEYLAMLDESFRQIKEGRVVVKTMEELEAMAAE